MAEFMNTHFINNYNMLDEKGREHWRKHQVNKICMIPGKP